MKARESGKLECMKLVSINIGQSAILESALYKKPTGIGKRAVPTVYFV